MAFNCESLTPEQSKELKDAFCLFDMDSDNRICTKELGRVLRALGLDPTEQVLQQMMTRFDKDNSGFIEYEEYLNLIQTFTLSKEEVEVKLRQAFLFFDRDKNGILSIEELNKVLMAMGEPLSYQETSDILKLADLNHDGKLNVNEFTKFLCERV